MKKISKILFFVLCMGIFLLPLGFIHAAGLVPDCGTDCGYKDLMVMINKIINFVLFDLSIPIAAIMFVYAGVSLIAAQSSEGMTKAKHIFQTVVLGILFVAGAWLIVHTVLAVLGYNGTWFDL